MALAGGAESAVSYWVYPWTGIEELGFSLVLPLIFLADFADVSSSPCGLTFAI